MSKLAMQAARDAAPTIRFRFDGQDVEAREGDSIASALLAGGSRRLRAAVDGTARGMFCGIGVCFDCIVTVDGVPNQRACMIRAGEGMQVTSMPRT